MESIRRLPWVLGTVAALGLAHSALATTTTYHTTGGDHCQPGVMRIDGSGLSYFRHAPGFIYADAGAGAYTNVDCALPRFKNDSTLSSAWISVKRAASDTQLYWIYSSYPVPGGSLMQSSKQAASTTAGYQEIFFSLTTLPTYTWGYFQANGNLGNGDQLWGVQYGEVTNP